MPDTLLGKLKLLTSKGLPLISRLLRNEKVYYQTYPFTRGTGNFVNTLIDAYQLTCDRSYLERVDTVIRETFHPNDDISSRNLDDIELTWSYTVFLQSVAKYLDIKEQLNEFDDSFHYARDSFLHYADWILNNEQPFLSKPEMLDYPNKTWVAQEIRKANVLCLAYKYTGGMNKNYLDKAQFFYDYIVEQLENHPEQTYTRIMVILLQNHGPHDFFKEKQNLQKFQTVRKIEYKGVPQRTLGSLVKLFFLELMRGITGFSLTKEIKWLNNRL